MHRFSRLLMALSLCLLSLQPLASAYAEIIDNIVAVVGEQVITQSQLDERIKQVKENLLRRGVNLPPTSVLSHQVLQQMIDQQLMLIVAQRMNISISDMQLNQSIERIAERNNMSLTQLKTAIETQGMDYDEYREQIRKEMITAQAQQEVVGAQINITEQDIENAMNQLQERSGDVAEYHLLDIVVPLSNTPTPNQVEAAENKAAKIIAKLRQGADFEKTAVAESSGQFALKGGDLGWRQAAQLPALFAQAVKNMKPGAIEGPLRAANGLHIIKLAGKRNDNTRQIITEYEVRQILLKTSPLDDDKKVKADMLALRKQIQQGGDFAKIAKAHSEGPNAFNGGNVGWINRSIVVPSFAKVMETLPVGQLSQPFKSGNGWHMIEILQKRQKDETETFRKNQIKELLYQRKFEEGIENWVDQLREVTYIKVLTDAPADSNT